MGKREESKKVITAFKDWVKDTPLRIVGWVMALSAFVVGLLILAIWLQQHFPPPYVWVWFVLVIVGIIWLSFIPYYRRTKHDKTVNKNSGYCFVWLSGKFSLGDSLIITPTIKINTLKSILVQSMALEINGQIFSWDQDDTWAVAESETIDDINFRLPLNIPRGKQLAKIKSIVDGKEYNSDEFIIDLPRNVG